MPQLDYYRAENLDWCIEVLAKTAGSVDELAKAYRAALVAMGQVVYLDKLIAVLQGMLPGLSYWHAREMMLTKSEATHFAGCSLPALNEAIRRGKVKCYNVDGGPHVLIFDALDYAKAEQVKEVKPTAKKKHPEVKGKSYKVTDFDGTTTLKTV